MLFTSTLGALVKINNAIVPGLQSWNFAGVSGQISGSAQAGTKGYALQRTGTRSTGSDLTTESVVPVCKINDLVMFDGFTGGDREYKFRALCNEITANFDWGQRIGTLSYRFISSFVSDGDELTETTTDGATFGKAVITKVIPPIGDVVLINDEPVCFNTLTITLSSSPNILPASSCNTGWQSAVGGSVTASVSGVIPGDALSTLPDVEEDECFKLKVLVDHCDDTKFWEMLYLTLSSKGGIDISPATGSAAIINMNAVYNPVGCGCDITTDGYIVAPGGIVMTGDYTAPEAA